VCIYVHTTDERDRRSTFISNRRTRAMYKRNRQILLSGNIVVMIHIHNYGGGSNYRTELEKKSSKCNNSKNTCQKFRAKNVTGVYCCVVFILFFICLYCQYFYILYAIFYIILYK